MENLALRRPPPANDRLRAFLSALALYAKDWLDDRRYVDEHRRFIEELDDAGELPSFLEALGASREELDAWSISPIASAELLNRMMGHVGVPPEVLMRDSLVRDDLERACRCCPSWKQCRRWMRAPDEAPDAYQEFCPNAGILERLRRTALAAAAC